MIEQFVNNLTLEQTKQVLIDCLEVLKEQEFIEVMEIPADLPSRGEVGEIDCYWMASGDAVVKELEF